MNILDRGLQVEDDRLLYAWFYLSESMRGRYYHAVSLRELAAVPIEAREDPDVLGKQWAAVRGMYNAGVDFLYAAAGIYSPEHVGVVQFYGASGDGATPEDAACEALRSLAAVEATLANYPQSKVVAPDLRWVKWYLDFIADEAHRLVAILGHPDPRQGRRGLGREGALADQSDDDLAAQQNELLFRGLAKLREDFVFQVTARHLSRRRLTDALVKVAEVAGNVASRRRGSISIGMSVGIPILAAIAQGVGGGHAGAESQAHSTADGVSEGWGEAHTDSWAHTQSHAVSVGEAETWGESHGTAVSHGVTESEAHTDSESQSHTESESVARTESHASTDSVGSSWSRGGMESHAVSQAHTDSSMEGHGSQASWGAGVARGTQEGGSQAVTDSHTGTHTQGVSGQVSAAPLGIGGSAGYNESAAETIGRAEMLGESWGASEVHSQMGSVGVSTMESTGEADTIGESHVAGASWSQGGMSSHSESHGAADTVSRGTADTTTKGTADTKGRATSEVTTESHMTSHAVTRSRAETWGDADTVGGADTRSQQWGRSHQEGEMVGIVTSRAGQRAAGGGFSTGLAPSVSIGRSWQTEDDVADRLTEVLRGLEGVVNQASAEGGFMTDAFLITASDRGATAAEALVPQAFHGPSVPTPVLTIRPQPGDEPVLRGYALAFIPTPFVARHDLFDGLLYGEYNTLLTAGQVAALTAPGLFEEGTAVTVTEQIPPGVGFYPEMPGDATLGHQYSPSTADLTTALVRLDPSRHFHTLFAADTGYGKSIAATRMVYETVIRWQMPTVVLDWGAGWRQLLNAPGLKGRVDILQLWPHAARPLRWNPLQIGRNIPPETQWRAFADIFGAIARMGVKRQKQELLEALRKVYLRAGVLIDDPDVRYDPALGRVQPDEALVAGAAPGTPLGNLSHEQRQALAVHRSRLIGLADLYREIQAKLKRVPPRDTMLTGVLEGILFRMNALVQGAAALQFAPGDDAIQMEDLIRDWGVTIIEGGSFLDEFGKAFLLGWAGWHLYTDAVARRVRAGAAGGYAQIVFEEANKIFGGIADGGGEDDTGGAAYTAQQFGNMFRDSRKYGIWLHAISQSPHLIPQDIVSSCNNLVTGFLKNPKDKDVILSALAKSEKGFTDEAWRRFLSDMAIGQFFGRFGYAGDRHQLRPVLFRPLPVEAVEPDDAEIERKLGAIRL